MGLFDEEPKEEKTTETPVEKKVEKKAAAPAPAPIALPIKGAKKGAVISARLAPPATHNHFLLGPVIASVIFFSHLKLELNAL